MGNEGESDTLGERLSAPLSTDPLQYLMQVENDRSRLNHLLNSYSQATAYALTLFNFENDQERLSAYLAISRPLLVARIRYARNFVKIQNSLFDFVEKIAEDFEPKRGQWRRYPDVSEAANDELDTKQLALQLS
jgi:hypothetical protein